MCHIKTFIIKIYIQIYKYKINHGNSLTIFDNVKLVQMQFGHYFSYFALTPPLDSFFIPRLIPQIVIATLRMPKICHARTHLFSEIVNFKPQPDYIPIIIIISYKFDWNSITFSLGLIAALQSAWKISLTELTIYQRQIFASNRFKFIALDF